MHSAVPAENVSHFTSAEKFLAALGSVGYDQRPHREMVPAFRGISDVDHHHLVPSLLRPSVRPLVFKLCTTSGIPLDVEFGLRHSELSILLRFYERCNRAGLPMPTAESGLLSNADRSRQVALGLLPGVRHDPSTDWLSPGLCEIAGLAQHFGLPTRLLDWSHDPLVAAFFAAHDAAERLHAESDSPSVADEFSKRIGVWVLNVKSIMNRECPLEVVYPPYAGNPNLQAQQGLLSHWRDKETIDEKTPIDDEALEGKAFRWNDDVAGSSDPIQLHLYTFPATSCLVLCKLLEHRGYHHARIFPGYAGAAAAVRAFGRDRLTVDSIDHGAVEAEVVGWAGSGDAPVIRQIRD